jgi:hypothetical protein
MTRTPARRSAIDSPAWLVLAWSGVALFAVALGALLLDDRWSELRIASCFFLPYLALMLCPHGLPNLLLAGIAGCFLLSAAGWALDWYAVAWWFDVLIHGLNPIPMVAGSMFMLWKADLVAVTRPGRFVLASASYGLALGIAWEAIEVTYLHLTWPDTILDLVMDAAGSALGGWLALWLIARRGSKPVGRRPLQGTFAAHPVTVPTRDPRRG